MRGLAWRLLVCVALAGCRTAALPAGSSRTAGAREGPAAERREPRPEEGRQRASDPAPQAEGRLAPFHVCIDPGHPSENNDGRTLSHGLREVTLCWQVALLLKRQLEQAGVQVTLTKQQEGQFVPNRDRALLANSVGADLLLRLHADAGGGTGFTVYYPRRQGVAEGETGPSPEVLRASAAAARRFYPAFATALKGRLRDNGLRGDEQTLIGKRQGALTGSIFSRVPTLLVEMVFLTNARDADWIRQAPNQQRMAAALAQGVLALRPREPLPAAGENGQ